MCDGYSEHLLHSSLVSGDLCLGHYLGALSDPLHVHKLDSRYIIDNISLWVNTHTHTHTHKWW